MTITLNGTTGINTPGVVNTAAETVATTLAVTGVSTLTGGFTVGATAAPAFSAYAGATTSVSNDTFTKVLFSLENFDTNNNFASSRFTPTVAGYYQINANIGFPVATGLRIALYKNGSVYVVNSADGTSAVLDGYGHTAALIYCNGSTDYIEVYAYSNGNGTTTVYAGASITQFSGAMVRSA